MVLVHVEVLGAIARLAGQPQEHCREGSVVVEPEYMMQHHWGQRTPLLLVVSVDGACAAHCQVARLSAAAEVAVVVFSAAAVAAAACYLVQQMMKRLSDLFVANKHALLQISHLWSRVASPRR